ncbi:E3 ISG15--protein ligase HERC5 [Camelus dromedarius]|uniref:E3 ISG15--protein ligase HERC5 n=1 Tax=Camelus dromedarius TaxID=9838 RepID=A0A5N4EH11_CAMDR|nr:E3 ISG15--protein ligase HERC5 [Camelus dromedarius]
MEQRSQKSSRGGAGSTPGRVPASRPPASWTLASRPAQPRGSRLWLFPSAAGLRSALSRRTEATRQMCCTHGRLAVLERGGAGIEVHQLLAESDGARKPKCIKLGKKMKIHSMDQGVEHMLILSSDGKPFEYNYSMEHARFQCILQEKSIIQITCGDYHSLALAKDKDYPALIEALDNQTIEFLACGGSHSALLTKDGLVFTFGAGKYGQLGHNSTQNELKPCLVTGLVGNRVTQIACGRRHTLAFVSDLGKVFSFGSGKEGQLGNGGTHNQLIPLPMKLSSNEELKFESRTSEKELIMIAGGNQSILLWMEKENSYVNLRRKIPTLNEGTVKRWIADVGTKRWQNTKRIAGEMVSIHLDLNIARNIFKKLTQKDWITNTVITTCLRENLIKSLPFHSPHQEALAVFFLLPECPVMHDYNNWESLVVPFAEAVCKMSGQSSRVLEEYWASLQESTFITLVQMFKNAIVAQLHYWNESAENNCHIKALLEMLKKLHREKKLRMCMRLAGIMGREGSPLALLPTFNLTVRRNHLIEDALNQLNQFENEDLRRELLVSFSGEIGYDFGGVRAEFFHCLFKEMTRPEYGLFTYPEEASCMWFPVKPLFEKKSYFFFGVLCGLCLFNCNVANIPFPLALFKKLLDQTPSLEDLKELSPVLGKTDAYSHGVKVGVEGRELGIRWRAYRIANKPPFSHLGSLQTLLDDEGNDFGEVFHVCFNVHWDKNDVDLIPDGSHVIVSQTNKRDYVSKYVNYIFNISVKAVYEEFQRGFYKVCDKEIIEFFHPEELKDVIIGNTDYDWETFEKNAHYAQGYDNSHPTIVMFWKALHKLTLEEKKKFLVFLTGTDRIQVKGLQNMKITFCCPENLNERDPIRAQTCFSVLYLPKYSTMERVEEALQVAINNNRGFG